MKKALVCLSSGTTVQYRLDILRVMALPEGAEIQFRYDADLIDASIRPSLGRDKRHDAPVLLAYLDLTVPVTTPGPRAIFPCRHARLIASDRLGQFYILRFRLGAFCHCPNIDSFRKHLASKGPPSEGRKTARKLGFRRGVRKGLRGVKRYGCLADGDEEFERHY